MCFISFELVFFFFFCLLMSILRASDPLKMKLQTVVSCQAGAGNQS